MGWRSSFGCRGCDIEWEIIHSHKIHFLRLSFNLDFPCTISDPRQPKPLNHARISSYGSYMLLYRRNISCGMRNSPESSFEVCSICPTYSKLILELWSSQLRRYEGGWCLMWIISNSNLPPNRIPWARHVPSPRPLLHSHPAASWNRISTVAERNPYSLQNIRISSPALPVSAPGHNKITKQK